MLHRPVPLLLAALLALAAGRAFASDVEVSPVLLELGRGAPSAILSVRNAGGAPALFQLRAYAWGERPEGGMELAPAPEVMVYPPLLALEPGASRNVRVGVAAPPGAVERSWRVFVEELPPERPPGSPTEIRVLTRIGIPVFLVPEKAEARPEIVGLAAAGGKVTFTLRNGGTTRFRPDAIEVVLVGDAAAVLGTHRAEGWYVLAGGERRYAFELPAADAPALRAVVARAVTPAGAIEARLALPDGARAP